MHPLCSLCLFRPGGTMVTYGGMAKQPVIASVVSRWGRQACTWAWTPQLSALGQCLPLGEGRILQVVSEAFVLRASVCPSVSPEPAHF